MKKQVVDDFHPKVTIKYENVQSLIDAHLVYDGQVTKRHYEWVRAGAIVSVDERDVSELLAKRYGGKPCCGGDESPEIFQLAE